MTTSVSKTSVSKCRTRAVCWTMFNYEDHIDNIKQYITDNCEYGLFGIEVCPTTQRKHLQGYCYYRNPIQYPNKKFRNLLVGVHDEIARGSPAENKTYCSKGGDVWEHGTCPQQGTRVDWSTAIEQLQTISVSQVIQQQPHLMPSIRALERYQQICNEPLNRDVKCYVLIGESGTGKSKWAYDHYPDLYSKPDGKWYDGYKGQKTLLLDDFYGDIPYATLLKVLDRYPLLVEVKGGSTYAQWDTIIITSNYPADRWYTAGLTPALERRLKNITIDYNPHATEEILSQAQSV